MNDENLFPDSSTFHGFRFADPEKIPCPLQQAVTQPEGPSRFVDLTPQYPNWGIGEVVW